MNHKMIARIYVSLGAALTVGCLYAGTASRNDVSPSGEAAKQSAGILQFFSPEDTTDRFALPAEKVFKNIKVLNGMSARDLLASMSFISSSLGVRCSHCHVQGDFPSDAKPTKSTARSMILMTNDINTRNFSVQTVTCNTCHRGSTMPLGVLSLSQGAWERHDLAAPSAFMPDSSTVEAVLSRYVAALGGAPAMGKIKTRATVASEVHSSGETATVETYQKAPDVFRSTTSTGGGAQGAITELSIGTAAWMSAGNRPPTPADNVELEQVMRAAEFFPAADLRRLYSSVKLLGVDTVGGRTFRVLSATRGKTRERLYFDAGTGLLARRYVEFRTPLGPIPFAVEYSDYREADKVRVPYVMKWNTPRGNWTDTITQLRHNVTIADSVFAKPK
jgi:hypothetical protein